MNIGIIGATGNIGQRILTEARSRGHQVTAFTRDQSRIPKHKDNLTWKTINILDPDSIAAGIGGLDVLVSTYHPGNAARDLNGTVEQSISHPETRRCSSK
jgi:putative NADH-flavin reductase